jgi:hypothetical protein
VVLGEAVERVGVEVDAQRDRVAGVVEAEAASAAAAEEVGHSEPKAGDC